MSKNTFQLINNSIIYSFDYEDKKLKRLTRKRVYGNLMTEDFAVDYLTIGTPEEIIERKKQFRVLPEKIVQIDENTAKEIKYPEKLADMKKYAVDKGYPEGEFSEISKKADMVVYLDSKSIEESGSEDEGDTGIKESETENQNTDTEDAADENTAKDENVK